jgi:Protein kinase domain
VEPFPWVSANGVGGLQVLREEGGVAFCRGWRDDAKGTRDGVLVAISASQQPTPATLDRLAHEYSLKDELGGTWAVRPLEHLRDGGRTALVLEDPGGELLSRFASAPTKVEHFLRIAVGVAAALGKVHEHGLIHKDIKPANILANPASGEIRLTSAKRSFSTSSISLIVELSSLLQKMSGSRSPSSTSPPASGPRPLPLTPQLFSISSLAKQD